MQYLHVFSHPTPEKVEVGDDVNETLKQTKKHKHTKSLQGAHPYN